MIGRGMLDGQAELAVMGADVYNSEQNQRFAQGPGAHSRSMAVGACSKLGRSGRGGGGGPVVYGRTCVRAPLQGACRCGAGTSVRRSRYSARRRRRSRGQPLLQAPQVVGGRAAHRRLPPQDLLLCGQLCREVEGIERTGSGTAVVEWPYCLQSCCTVAAAAAATSNEHVRQCA